MKSGELRAVPDNFCRDHPTAGTVCLNTSGNRARYESLSHLGRSATTCWDCLVHFFDEPWSLIVCGALLVTSLFSVVKGLKTWCSYFLFVSVVSSWVVGPRSMWIASLRIYAGCYDAISFIHIDKHYFIRSGCRLQTSGGRVFVYFGLTVTVSLPDKVCISVLYVSFCSIVWDRVFLHGCFWFASALCISDK